MREGRGAHAADEASDRAINEIEGYLLWEAEKGRARTRADAFCASLPWLTDSQRAEVARRYCQDHADLSRVYLRRIADRSTALRAEYQAVYQVLRRRLLVACGAGAAAVVVTALVTVLAAVRTTG